MPYKNVFLPVYRYFVPCSSNFSTSRRLLGQWQRFLEKLKQLKDFAQNATFPDFIRYIYKSKKF